MTAIQSVSARQILDSRGEATIETSIYLQDGTCSTASVPQGASTGKFEAKIAIDPKDHSKEAGVKKAIENVSKIGEIIKGFDPITQSEIDKKILELDGTITKANLGANATLSVSLAVAKAAAQLQKIPLWQHVAKLYTQAPHKFPTPMFNFIEGGKHSDNLLEFQEFLLIPDGVGNFSKQLSAGVNLYHRLKKYLQSYNASINVADEGGFAPELGTNKKALSTLNDVIKSSGYNLGEKVFLGIDAAANSFHKGENYNISECGGDIDSKKLIKFYKELSSDFKLSYIEDPVGEEDIQGWKMAMQQLGDNTQIVGDDLTTTNPHRLQMAIEENTINAMIVKPNQIGTLTQTLAVAHMARHSGLKITVSHRSGETEDTSIADIAVGIGADQVKFGAPARERALKYNRLSQIYQNQDF